MCTVLNVPILLIVLTSLHVRSQDEDYSFFETTTSGKLAEGEQKLSESIRKALDHFKQPNPEGWPGLDVPDPYLLPDTTQSVGFGASLTFTETVLHGISKFRVLYVKTEIEDMECRAALVMDKLHIRGKYIHRTWFTSTIGSLTSNITDIKATAIATLGVERNGKLRAQDILLDITFQNIAMNIENAGILATLLSGIVNSMGSYLFESIKPVLLRDAHQNIREEINKKLDEVVGDIEFPNTISPIDMIIVDVRKKLREMKMDPFKVNDYNNTSGVFEVRLYNTWLTGLSSLYRIGNISLYLENNTLVADFCIGIQELGGSTFWEVKGIGGYIFGAGSSSFSVQYIQGRFILVQPLDTRRRMELRDLELELGNIQIGFDGAGTLDYFIELSANILPTLLRYQIIDAIINPIKWKLQRELDDISIEGLIVTELPELDKMQADGFQLAELRMTNNTTDEVFDKDEFFNF
ncbi:uncharacterized protein LOC123864614 [Maniola jurtina]|uniref:uncharacterized protein LOC123864614 n=1 Tax=Maniola jurtina TaxID=191418 RepID=UPI001E689608|nr:uncharacterized protein LOC123864614 [Maniola jurtina]